MTKLRAHRPSNPSRANRTVGKGQPRILQTSLIWYTRQEMKTKFCRVLSLSNSIHILLHWDKIFVFYEKKLCNFIQKQTFQHSPALLRDMMHSSGTEPKPHTPSSPLKLFLPLCTSVLWLYLGTTCTFLNKLETLQKRPTKLSLTKQTFPLF